MAAWRHAGLDVPCVAVNLSPLNFQNAKLAAVVAETIAANGLPPETLMLEITEGVLVNERSAAIETMNAIRKLGVGLSLDDFGTGYSSLSRLAHLPIRELKIDRSFMRNIERDANALAIATAVVRVGQSLKMAVVAEGVETEGQRKLLAGLGCDVVQGYLCAPAMSPEAFERWLLDHVAEQARMMLQEHRGGPLATDAVVADRFHGGLGEQSPDSVGWAKARMRRAHPSSPHPEERVFAASRRMNGTAGPHGSRRRYAPTHRAH